MNGADELVPYDEAARLLGVNPATVRQLVYWKDLRAETLPGYSRRRGVRRSELLRYAEKRARGASTSGVLLPSDITTEQAKERLMADLFWGISTEGADGMALRRDVREQVAILRRTSLGLRELRSLGRALDRAVADSGEPSILLDAERQRIAFFRGLIATAVGVDRSDEPDTAPAAPEAVPAADAPPTPGDTPTATGGARRRRT